MFVKIIFTRYSRYIYSENTHNEKKYVSFLYIFYFEIIFLYSFMRETFAAKDMRIIFVEKGKEK